MFLKKLEAGRVFDQTRPDPRNPSSHIPAHGAYLSAIHSESDSELTDDDDDDSVCNHTRREPASCPRKASSGLANYIHFSRCGSLSKSLPETSQEPAGGGPGQPESWVSAGFGAPGSGMQTNGREGLESLHIIINSKSAKAWRPPPLPSIGLDTLDGTITETVCKGSGSRSRLLETCGRQAGLAKQANGLHTQKGEGVVNQVKDLQLFPNFVYSSQDDSFRYDQSLGYFNTHDNKERVACNDGFEPNLDLRLVKTSKPTGPGSNVFCKPSLSQSFENTPFSVRKHPNLTLHHVGFGRPAFSQSFSIELISTAGHISASLVSRQSFSVNQANEKSQVARRRNSWAGFCDAPKKFNKIQWPSVSVKHCKRATALVETVPGESASPHACLSHNKQGLGKEVTNYGIQSQKNKRLSKVANGQEGNHEPALFSRNGFRDSSQLPDTNRKVATEDSPETRRAEKDAKRSGGSNTGSESISCNEATCESGAGLNDVPSTENPNLRVGGFETLVPEPPINAHKSAGPVHKDRSSTHVPSLRVLRSGAGGHRTQPSTVPLTKQGQEPDRLGCSGPTSQFDTLLESKEDRNFRKRKISMDSLVTGPPQELNVACSVASFHSFGEAHKKRRHGPVQDASVQQARAIFSGQGTSQAAEMPNGGAQVRTEFCETVKEMDQLQGPMLASSHVDVLSRAGLEGSLGSQECLVLDNVASLLSFQTRDEHSVSSQNPVDESRQSHHIEGAEVNCGLKCGQGVDTDGELKTESGSESLQSHSYTIESHAVQPTSLIKHSESLDSPTTPSFSTKPVCTLPATENTGPACTNPTTRIRVLLEHKARSNTTARFKPFPIQPTGCTSPLFPKHAPAPALNPQQLQRIQQMQRQHFEKQEPGRRGAGVRYGLSRFGKVESLHGYLKGYKRKSL